MKKFLLASVIAVSVLTAVSSAYVAADTAMRLNRASASSTKEIRELSARISELEEDTECFAILRETGGVIGLYDKDGEVLLCTIDTPVISLPDNERSRIMVGMEVESPYQFMKLFESLSE